MAVGDALVTKFDAEQLVNAPLTYAGETTDEQMWDNFHYFLQQVLPVAEAAKVKLALHPDDPLMSPVLGLARIMRSMEAFQRVIELADSPVNGITFCQGNFAAMGTVDIPAAIRYFGARQKLFFAHFRDVRGSVPLFEETFHDEGKTDMAAAMRAYRDIGFTGPMRPDHAPTMEGESNDNPGYMVRGKIFAIIFPPVPGTLCPEQTCPNLRQTHGKIQIDKHTRYVTMITAIVNKDLSKVKLTPLRSPQICRNPLYTAAS